MYIPPCSALRGCGKCACRRAPFLKVLALDFTWKMFCGNLENSLQIFLNTFLEFVTQLEFTVTVYMTPVIYKVKNMAQSIWILSLFIILDRLRV